MATEEVPDVAIKMEVGESSDADDKTPEETKESKPVDITAGAAAAANPHYRVKISGLPRFYTPGDPLLQDFKKLLHFQLGLDFKYIRSPKKGNSWLYVTFYNQAHQEKALKLLKHYNWKGRTLICTLVVADVLKRKQEDCGQESSKKPRLDIPIEEQMLMATIPYHTVSYEEQLSKKNEEAECLFKWLAECMEKKTPQLSGYIDQEVKKDFKKKLPFKLDEVRKSPVIDGYRNKCEFRIGMDPESKQVVVGYRVDNQEDDNIAVAQPDALRHLPKEMLDVVKVFEKFVRESPYGPQIVNHDTGVWRLLHVRINKQKQVMVVVLINPTILSYEEVQKLKQDIVLYFTEGPASGLNVVSLYFHTDNDIKSLGGDKLKRPQGQLDLLWGQSHIEEQMLDLNLDIDPNFYFQNNTWGAEELYKAVMEVAGVDQQTTVLDLCCGSGGMGMMFAKHCKKVIGVEVMDVNVDDAKKLAAKNGLTNCEFLQGAVDDLFPELIEKLKGEKVIPILDPPRAGISTKLILSLRKMTEAQRIVYVCSNHKLPSKNIIDMSMLEGENKVFEGTSPFFPKRVIPVDISPHSLRCELVILLERLSLDTMPKPVSRRPRGKSFFSWQTNRARGRKASRDWASLPREMAPPGRNMMRSMSARDSLYPPPLRGNLYGGYEPGPPRPMRPRPDGYDFGPGPNHYGPPPRRDPGLNRYSDFRRDVEDAIDSSYQPRGRVNQRLAMANAMLEQGLRLASEAMAEDYRPSPPPPPPPSYIRRGRGGMRGGMSGNGVSAEAWRNSWSGDDYDVMPARPRGGFGGPARIGRAGGRAARGGGAWRR